jgi:hypothetical protein
MRRVRLKNQLDRVLRAEVVVIIAARQLRHVYWAGKKVTYFMTQQFQRRRELRQPCFVPNLRPLVV